jgi:hypothetical protein
VAPPDARECVVCDNSSTTSTIQLAFHIRAQRKIIVLLISSRNLLLASFRRFSTLQEVELLCQADQQARKQVRTMYHSTVKQYFLRPGDHAIWGLDCLPCHKSDHHAQSSDVARRGNEANAACIARRKIASLVVEDDDPQVFRSLQQELRSRRIVTPHGAVASVLSEVLTSAGKELLRMTNNKPSVARHQKDNFRSSTSRTIMIEEPTLVSALQAKGVQRASVFREKK